MLSECSKTLLGLMLAARLLVNAHRMFFDRCTGVTIKNPVASAKNSQSATSSCQLCHRCLDS